MRRITSCTEVRQVTLSNDRFKYSNNVDTEVSIKTRAEHKNGTKAREQRKDNIDLGLRPIPIVFFPCSVKLYIDQVKLQ